MHFPAFAAAIAASAAVVSANPLEKSKHIAHIHPHVEVTRYAKENCEAASHIKEEIQVKPNKCHDFLAREPGFRSFSNQMIYEGDKRHKFDYETCHLTIYESHDCMGKGYPAALVRDSERQCQNFAPEGRFGNSVFLDCGKGPVSKPAHPEKTVVVHEDDKKKKEEKTKHATETVTPLSGVNVVQEDTLVILTNGLSSSTAEPTVVVYTTVLEEGAAGVVVTSTVPGQPAATKVA